MQGKQRIDHRGLDTAPVAAVFLVIDDPVFSGLDSPAANTPDRFFLEYFRNTVENEKELVYPGIEPFVMRRNEKLLDAKRIRKIEFGPKAEHYERGIAVPWPNWKIRKN